MNTKEINRKKALWVIENKLYIKGAMIIKESSMENLADGRFEIAAKLGNNNMRRVVTKNKTLADEILNCLVRLQTKGK